MTQVAKFTAMIESLAVKQAGRGDGRRHHEQGDHGREGRKTKQQMKMRRAHELNRSLLKYHRAGILSRCRPASAAATSGRRTAGSSSR